MGKVTGFMEYERLAEAAEAPEARKKHYREFVLHLSDEEAKQQGARCMDCGTPFCMSGCPVNNIIPDWNDLVYRGDWKLAIETLHSTNNFPEFTGRVCPAPCEASCVLNINNDPVGIKSIEHFIIDKGWDEGWVVPRPPTSKTGRSVAVVGSGPAGLACAQQLARAGHDVTVYERDEAAGGLVRFGVPEFKIEKALVERRVEQLAAEGVAFVFGADVGRDVDVDELRVRHDALVLATGSRVPRDLPVQGRELDGVHFAMEYLYARTRLQAHISAAGKHVVVIGGGDTGADCVGHAHREGAASVTQIELVGEPPVARPDELTPWPLWPMKLRTSYALKEGGERDFAISTTALTGSNGRVEQIHWQQNRGSPPFDVVPGTEEARPAGLVLLAMGFLGPEAPVLDALGVERDARSNVDAARYATSVDGVFAAGDARRGQSLIVWAINEGRQCAAAVDAWLADASTDASISIAAARRAE